MDTIDSLFLLISNYATLQFATVASAFLSAIAITGNFIVNLSSQRPRLKVDISKEVHPGNNLPEEGSLCAIGILAVNHGTPLIITSVSYYTLRCRWLRLFHRGHVTTLTDIPAYELNRLLKQGDEWYQLIHYKLGSESWSDDELYMSVNTNRTKPRFQRVRVEPDFPKRMLSVNPDPTKSGELEKPIFKIGSEYKFMINDNHTSALNFEVQRNPSERFHVAESENFMTDHPEEIPGSITVGETFSIDVNYLSNVKGYIRCRYRTHVRQWRALTITMVAGDNGRIQQMLQIDEPV